MALALKTVILGNVIVMAHKYKTTYSFSHPACCKRMECRDVLRMGRFLENREQQSFLNAGLNTYENRAGDSVEVRVYYEDLGLCFFPVVALKGIQLMAFTGSPLAPPQTHKNGFAVLSCSMNSPLSYLCAFSWASCLLPEISFFFFTSFTKT